MLQDVPTMLGGRYRVVERLGRGGMADVYRAEDVVLRRPVAIKIFRGGVEREQHLARFRAEVRTLAGLTHPHLVALYDAGGDITEPWCAMEYVDGGSLADRDGALPPVDVARIGEQIAAGLAYVHECGIVHRDVKPSNVLLDARGDAFLSDFGIAKLVDGTRMTQSGLMIGTAAFLSPEQVRGYNASPASDVYALGLVLLEALTGHREYPGTPVESAVARLSRPPTVPAALDRDWGDLIRTMTAEDTDARPTPREVALRLRALARRLTGAVRFPPDLDDGLLELSTGGATGGEAADDEEEADGEAADGDVGDGEATQAPTGDGPDAQAVVTTSLPILSLPVTQEPRNLLGWLSPERRRRGAALLAASGVVVAVAVALPLIDGGRGQDVQAVRVDDGAVTQPSSTTDGQPEGAGGDGAFQLRKAPVEVPPLLEPDRVTGPIIRQGVRPRVAGVATTRPLRAKAPSPSPSPSPSASPSPTSSPSTSGPSSSASPSNSSRSSTASPTTSIGTGTTSDQRDVPLSASSIPSIESLSRTVSGGSGSGGSSSATDSTTLSALVPFGSTDLVRNGSAS
jgi:hypothetical protein